MNVEQGIRKVQQQAKRFLLAAPIIAGNEAVNFSLQAFRQQGWSGSTFEPWPARRVSWTEDSRRGRAILVDRAHLQRSIKIVETGSDFVKIGSNVPYARVHNEGFRGRVTQNVRAHSRNRKGVATVQSIKTKRTRSVSVITGTGQVRAHTRTINQRIPRRRFMGLSPYLNARIKRVLFANYKRYVG